MIKRTLVAALSLGLLALGGAANLGVLVLKPHW